MQRSACQFLSSGPNRVLNAAKPGHSADPVSAVTKKGKTLLGVEHPIQVGLDLQYILANVPLSTTLSGYMLAAIHAPTKHALPHYLKSFQG